jgi:integrase
MAPMARPYQINTRELRGSACIIFQIGSGYKGGGTGIWYFKINIEGGMRVRKSTKTSDEARATDIALDAYYLAQRNIKDGVPNITVKMKRVIKEWLADEKNRIGRKIEGIAQRTYDNYEKCGNVYLMEYFGEMDINSVSDDDISAYWEWRQTYYQNPANRKKTNANNIALNPKENTLQQDQSSLSRLFRLAAKKKYIHRREIPEIKRPRSKKSYDSEGDVRTAYSVAEVAKLKKSMEADEKVKGLRQLDIMARRRIRLMVLIMLETGLRAVECRNLRQKDVTDYQHHNGNTYLRIWARGKTAPRAIMVSNDLREHFEALDKINYRYIPGKATYTPGVDLNVFRQAINYAVKADDDLIFRNDDGKWNEQGHQLFKKAAIRAGVFYDDNGAGRPLTSLRHTYITNALSTGSIPIDMLASNCGNSVSEIERTYRHVANELNAPHVVSPDDTGQSYAVKTVMKNLPNPEDVEEIPEDELWFPPSKNKRNSW